jgi:Ca2+-binding RTX toxin-like protein
VPVATVLGERHLLIDASYGYVRIGATRVASGYATVTLSQTRSFPFGETRADEGEETRRVRFSSVAQLTGDDLDGCPFNPGPSAKWAEQMGFGAAADDVEANGNPRASGLRRGACANRKLGTNGADRLMGTSAGDAISGAGGADSVSGLAGHDCLKGDSGSDSLGGGAGHDSLQGGRGGDKLVGGAGNDALSGGAGTDSFSAGAGNDVIHSRDGRAEKVSCGSGKDSVRADASDRLAGCESRRIG